MITVLAPRSLPFPALRLLPKPERDGDPQYLLETDAEVAVLVRTTRVTVCVLAGYETDLASVPAWLQVLYRSADPKTALAALVHDALYETMGGTVPHPRVRVDGPPVSRAEADAILAALMRLSGCGRLRRALYFAAVRLFGAKLWNSHAR